MEIESKVGLIGVSFELSVSDPYTTELTISFINCNAIYELLNGRNTEEIISTGSFNTISDSINEQREMAECIIKDLVVTNTEDGKLLMMKEDGMKPFVHRWSVESFKKMLVRYELARKLSLENSIRVVYELYIVEPVMES